MIAMSLGNKAAPPVRGVTGGVETVGNACFASHLATASVGRPPGRDSDGKSFDRRSSSSSSSPQRGRLRSGPGTRD
ncbi:MAG: hypothetical protein ACK559_41410, partial [bacterium]